MYKFLCVNIAKDNNDSDPVHAIVPLYYGQDIGLKPKINTTFKNLKNEINIVGNKLEESLNINGLDFNCYEKGSMFISPKKFTKKDLKTLKEPEASSKLLAAKRKEQHELIKNRNYTAAQDLTKEIKQIKTKARNRLSKYNNMTLSEIL